MAEIKVITVGSVQELQDALTPFLGSDAVKVANEVGAAVAAVEPSFAAVEEPELQDAGFEPCGEDCAICAELDELDEEVEEEYDPYEIDALDDLDEEVEEDFAFGEVIEDEETGYSFYRVFAVKDADDLQVRVTPEGVVTTGFIDGQGFRNVFAPQGAYDEVSASFDADDDTLMVTLTKVEKYGKPVEIENF